MSEVTRGYWAEVVCNNDFICVDTYSGYRGGDRRDPKGKQNLLPPDASDVALGEAVLDALAHSRWVLPESMKEDTDPAGVEYDSSLYDYKTNYPIWVNALMERYGYKTKRALFKGMKRVGIANENGVITMRPSHHYRLEGWEAGDLTEEDYVVIPATSPPEEIGAALRLALSRCTGS